jgi:acylphosphatase
MAISALHLTIHGRVQGVGFRAWLTAHANNRRVYGWVRNRKEGYVEAVLCGEMLELENIHAACLNGPLAAKVDKVDVKPWTGEIPESFEQLATV